MEEKKSRVVKYEALRRKIENMSYFDLEENTSKDSHFDLDNIKINVTNSNVRYNTLTVPLDELLKDSKRKDSRVMNSTQDIKMKDETKKGKSIAKGNVPFWKNWIFWLVSALCIGIIIMIICLIVLLK